MLFESSPELKIALLQRVSDSPDSTCNVSYFKEPCETCAAASDAIFVNDQETVSVSHQET